MCYRLHNSKIHKMLIKISDTQIYSDSFIRSMIFNAGASTLLVTFNDATTATLNGAIAVSVWNTLNKLFYAQIGH